MRLYNMSVPPKSSVRRNIVPLFEYAIFDPRDLARLLGCDLKELACKSREYLESHESEISQKCFPDEYMIARVMPMHAVIADDNKLSIKASSKNKTSSRIATNGNAIDYFQIKGSRCNDILTSIILFSRTVGDLYIPGRRCDFSQENFDKVLCFNKDDFSPSVLKRDTTNI